MVELPEEPSDGQIMPFVRFGKGQSFSDKTAYPRPNGRIEAFDIIGQVFSDLVFFFWDNASVSLPIIRFKVAVTKFRRDFFPKFLGGFFATPPNVIRNDQTVYRVVNHPNPTFPFLFPHKRPHLIRLQTKDLQVFHLLDGCARQAEVPGRRQPLRPGEGTGPSKAQAENTASYGPERKALFQGLLYKLFEGRGFMVDVVEHELAPATIAQVVLLFVVGFAVLHYF